MSETRTIYVANAGVPATGLTLTWESLKAVSDGGDITPQPTFTEVGGGFYKFTSAVEIGEQWCGVVDASATIDEPSERYLPILLGDSDLEKNTTVFCTPVYDETSDTVTFFVFMLRNGQVVGADDAEVVVYDSAHVEMFTVSGSSSTNGVFVLAKNTPEFESGEGYYCVGTVTVNSVDFVSVETMLVLD